MSNLNLVLQLFVPSHENKSFNGFDKSAVKHNTSELNKSHSKTSSKHILILFSSDINEDILTLL